MQPAKENKYALESLDGCIVNDRSELKRKFRFRCMLPNDLPYQEKAECHASRFWLFA